MKKILLFIIAIAPFVLVHAQDRWTIQYNGKTLLHSKKEDTAANVVSIKNLKKGNLIITYTPAKVDSKWGRRLAVYDLADNELYSREKFTITLPAAILKKWNQSLSQIKIYTWPLSKDPRIKLKVRRLHLFTINFT